MLPAESPRSNLLLKFSASKYFTPMLHVLAWTLVLFLPYMISAKDQDYKIGPLPGVYFTVSGLIHMIIFYGHALWLYRKFFNKAYWPIYLIGVILMIVLSVQLKLFILREWFTASFQEAGSHVVFPSVLALTVSVFYCIARDRILAEKMEKQKESHRLEMELKFLRSQINPHFLFNVLTNLTSLARKKSDQLEPSLLMLSDLMRYMLYETGRTVSLEQEINYLKSYIELQRLRLESDVNITFHTELRDDKDSYRIEPMLLIPFVENAFKYGTGDITNPLIDIRLTASNGVLNFQVKNKFDSSLHPNKTGEGIGLKNVRSRLQLLYPDQHDLVVHSDNKIFGIHLTLKLS